MPLAYEQVGPNLVVRLGGELDLVAAAEFKALVDDLLNRGKIRNLYVNLERVNFVDSSFIGALLGRCRQIQQIGGQMGLINPAPKLRPTLEMTGLFRMMSEFRSEPEALSAG
jgi:anti-sigma F factor antagonist